MIRQKFEELREQVKATIAEVEEFYGITAETADNKLPEDLFLLYQELNHIECLLCK